MAKSMKKFPTLYKIANLEGERAADDYGYISADT